ncbi:MAG: hypothetical protein J5861_08735 [Desulfovibrio sp.]|nr:hypothetical protein [Desulfovibrio sp.]
MFTSYAPVMASTSRRGGSKNRIFADSVLPASDVFAMRPKHDRAFDDIQESAF